MNALSARMCVIPEVRDRFTLSERPPSQHMQGWVAYGMSLACPVDASAEFRAGYAEHRECLVDILTARGAP